MTSTGSTTVAGIGIHSGLTCHARLYRHDGPLAFRRAGSYIEARHANVVSTDRTTVLGSATARIGLVEHLLAALRVAGFYSGVIIESDADELPILDGSALPWFESLAELGPPPAAAAPLTVDSKLVVEHNGSTAVVEPGRESLDCSIAFAHPAIGTQRWRGGPNDYQALLAARTFGLLSEAEALMSRGLARGAAVDHAIVFADDGPLRPLRFPDEPVRHKALDALGDLALLGRPLAATVVITRGSHTLHHKLVRALAAGVPAERGSARP